MCWQDVYRIYVSRTPLAPKRSMARLSPTSISDAMKKILTTKSKFAKVPEMDTLMCVMLFISEVIEELDGKN